MLTINRALWLTCEAMNGAPWYDAVWASGRPHIGMLLMGGDRKLEQLRGYGEEIDSALRRWRGGYV